jgi:hypothetical protein
MPRDWVKDQVKDLTAAIGAAHNRAWRPLKIDPGRRQQINTSLPVVGAGHDLTPINMN